MKKLFVLPLILSACLSCTDEHSHDHELHAHELDPLSYTIYTERTELFVEFKPLIRGEESNFIAHFTVLGEQFKALAEGSVTLSLVGTGADQSVTTGNSGTPGIFVLKLTPDKAGFCKLVFDIKTPLFSDKIELDSIEVFPDDEMAEVKHSHAIEEGDDITYLKEQAWKVDFASMPVKKQPFSDIIKTSGLLLSAPGDELIITANASGIVVFAGSNTIIGAEVVPGTTLFTLAGGDLTTGNVETVFKEAKINLDKARSDHERLSLLVKDKIVSEKEYLEAKQKYDNALSVFTALSKNYTSSGQKLSSPMNGFVKNILVREGQYVETGTPMAIVSRNKKLVLQANVSQKYFGRLNSITSANFKTTESDKFINTSELNGRVMSYGRSTDASSPFLPITFEIDNTGNLIPGSVAEVYLKSHLIPDAIVLPVSSLIEEQGTYFVYVQTGGESFQKREVKLGVSDGIDVQILSGVIPGERVVTKGAFQIKLSEASGELPVHGHEH